MAEVDEYESDPDFGIIRAPACDACRYRKIRCDRKTPCASCRTSHIACRSTKKQIERRQRLLALPRNEQRLQDYSDRLSQVENTIRALVDQQGQDATTTSIDPPSISVHIPRDSNSWKERVDFEGDSSFVAHSKHATQAFEEILDTTPYSDSGREALAAVARLKDVLSKGEAFSEGSVISNHLFHDVIEYPELARLPLPSTDIVLQLLRHVKAHRQRFFYDIITIDEQYLTNLCQKVFFATEEYSIAVFITVHVSLFYLFRDLPIQEARMMNLSSTDLGKIVSVCGTNASIAVKHLRLSMEATHENIEALWFAAMFVGEFSSSYSKWTLISTAARMCQDAGYNCISHPVVDPETTKKKLIFWYIYALDRGVSLNMGRPPMLRESYITVDRPRAPDEISSAWAPVFNNWLDFAQLQGEIYDNLFSPQAQRIPANVRSERAHRLAMNLRVLESSLVFEIQDKASQLAARFVMRSTLTLIYRTIPPPVHEIPQKLRQLKFSEQAVKVAREALTMHNEAWVALQDDTVYERRLFLHWTLLWCQFIPYIVIFGDAMTERRVSSLMLLEQSVSTLHGAAQISHACKKLHNACHILYRIVAIYLGAHSQESEARATSERSQQEAIPSPLTMQEYQGSPLLSTTMHMDTLLGDSTGFDLPFTEQGMLNLLDEWNPTIGIDHVQEIPTFLEHYLSRDTEQP